MNPLILHLVAKNDTNGNPRRCYLVIDPETATVIEAIDEGYQGRAAWKRKYPHGSEVCRIVTTPRQRRELLAALPREIR